MIKALLFIVLLFSGCSNEPAGHKYFPLQQGLLWEYQITTDVVDQDSDSKKQFSIETLQPTTLSDQYTDQPVYLKRTSDGTAYYYVINTGVQRIAKRLVIEDQPVFDAMPRMVLPAMNSLIVGHSWTTESKLYVLHSLPAYNIDLSHKQLSMSYEIAALDDVVEVPAGKYDNCLRIEGQSKVNLYADATAGYRDVLVQQTEWYAPGVGLVKLKRSEPMHTAVYKGGSMVFELVGFGD